MAVASGIKPGTTPLKWIQQQYNRVTKHLPNMSNMFLIKEDSPICLSCKRKLPEGWPPGYCSAQCYWNSLQKFRLQLSKQNKGEYMCALESCDKPSYIEYSSGTRRIHDYCCKGHAKEHRERIETVWPGSYQIINRSYHHHHHQCQSDHNQQHNYQDHHHHGYQLRSQTDSGHGPILFYDRDQPYYEFTNFADYEIEIDGIHYRTTEHYFQSQKLIGTPFLSKLCELPRPRQAFEYPRQPQVSVWVRQDWHSIKDDVMYRALIAKFTKYPHLKRHLLSTGDRKLVEHSPYDSYWGDGPDGNGQNRLGELLMRLRSAFRGERKGARLEKEDEMEVENLIQLDGIEQDGHNIFQKGEKDLYTKSDDAHCDSSKDNPIIKRKIKLAATFNSTRTVDASQPPAPTRDNGGNNVTSDAFQQRPAPTSDNGENNITAPEGSQPQAVSHTPPLAITTAANDDKGPEPMDTS